jgi:phosphohistidine swiveling domain-containing protein
MGKTPQQSGGSGKRGTFPRNALTQLDDFPANYTDAAGKVVVVKGDQTGVEFLSSGVVDDHKVKTNGTDGEAKFLIDKLKASTAISITADESLTDHKAAIGVNLGEQSDQAAAGNDSRFGKVKTNEADESLNYLIDKLKASTAISITADESLTDHKAAIGVNLGEQSDQAAAGNDSRFEKVKVSAEDDTAQYLLDKLQAGTAIDLQALTDSTKAITIGVKTDGTTIDVNESGQLEVKTPEDHLVTTNEDDPKPNHLRYKIDGGSAIDLSVFDGGESAGKVIQISTKYDNTGIVINEDNELSLSLGEQSDQAAPGNDSRFLKVRSNHDDATPGSLVDKLEAAIAMDISIDETDPDDHKVKIGVNLGTQSDQAAPGCIIAEAADASAETAAFSNGAKIVIRTDLM